MAINFRRLAGLLVLAAAATGCPTAVSAPQVTLAASSIDTVQVGQLVRLDAGASKDPQGRDLSFAWQFTAIPIGSAATLNDAKSATPSFLADVAGEYDVQVIVSNAFAAAAAQTVKVTVSACGGRAPVFGTAAITAKDAARSTVTDNFAVGATIVLASDVSDPDNSTTDHVCTTALTQAVSYQWKLIGQPAASTATLNNATAASPSFVADVPGSYTLRLVATDSTGRASTPFDQSFTVSPCGSAAPTAGTITPVSEIKAVGTTVQLTAFPDTADNSTACQAVLGAAETFTYQWSLPQLPNGSRATLNSTTAQNPSFTPDIEGTYVARLVVTASNGKASAAIETPLTGTNALVIPHCGNNAPVAAIAGPTSGFIGTLVQLSASATDPDGPVNGGANPASPACSPQVIAQTVTFRWSIVALPPGSQAQLNNPTGTNPSFTPDVTGNYTIQLVATDQAGLNSAPVTQTISVANCGNKAPFVTGLATVGSGVTVNPGSTVSLTATANDDDNTCLGANPHQTFSYAWTLVSRPSGSATFIVNPTTDPATAAAQFVPDVANGTYQAQLVITDSTGLHSAPAFISIFTNSCGSNAPVIDSAGGPTLPDPNTTVTLTASSHDPDNAGRGFCNPDPSSDQALSYQWTLVSRPAGSGAAITSTTTTTAGTPAHTDGTAQFKPDVIGPYQFSVVVTDSNGQSSAPKFVTIQTSDCGSRASTVDTAVATPTLFGAFTNPRPTLDSVALAGTVTDGNAACPGGGTASYLWSVISRPANSSAVITNPTSLTSASFIPDAPGDYQFQLDFIDSFGHHAAPKFARVTGDSCSLSAPVVSGFTVQSATQFQPTPFTFPDPSTHVTNNNCLPAAAANSYLWSMVSAPAGSAATLSNPAVAQPTFTPDRAGNYQFALNVSNGVGIAAAPVFMNLSVGGCSNTTVGGANLLGWTSIGMTKVVDPDTGTTNNPGNSFTPDVGAQVTVNAVAADPNASCGAHVTPISYQWAIVAAPAGSKATLSSTTGDSPAFVPDVPNATYQLSVVATDALGNTSGQPDFITIKTSKCGANVPTVSISNNGSTPLAGNVGPINAYDTTSTHFTALYSNNDDSVCSARFHAGALQPTFTWSISTVPTGGRASLSTATGGATVFEAFAGGTTLNPLEYQVHVVATSPRTGLSSDPTAASSYAKVDVVECGANAPVVSSISTFAHNSTTIVLSRPSVGQPVDLVANVTDADSSAGGCGASFGGAVASYDWTAVALPSGSVAPTTFSGATFPLTPDVAGAYTYSVVATDDTGLASAPVQVSISTAACQPVFGGVRAAHAGSFLAISAANASSSVTGNALTLDAPPAVTHTGTGSGAVSASGTPNGAHTYLVTIGLAAQYTVSVDGGAAGAPTNITLGASAPDANGVSLVFDSGTFVSGDTYSFSTSTGSFVVDSCVRQPTYAYAWSLSQKPAASQATLSSLSGAAPQLTPDVPGIYAVQLTVTDNAGLVSAPGTLTLNVDSCGKQKPVLPLLTETPMINPTTPGVTGAQPNAGQNVMMSLAGATVDGNGFITNETTIITNANSTTCGLGNAAVLPYTYHWALISIPTGSSAALSSTSAQRPQFAADLPTGTYQVALTVTDALGNTSDPAFLPVSSSACGAHAPVFASFGAGTATPNANTADLLSASITDGDNSASCPGFATTITGVSWSVVSAPAGSHASLISSATVPTSDLATPPTFFDDAAHGSGNSFRADAQGPYVVQAVAHASNGLSTATTVSLSVAPTGCGLNAPVITQIGVPTSRPSVGSSVTLTAFHTDADESAAVCPPTGAATPSYTWSLQSAPAGSSQTSPPLSYTSQSLSFTADLAGTYVWSVVATDSFGLVSAPVSVSVATGSCGPQLANASGRSEPIGLAVNTGISTENAGGGYNVTQGALVTLSTAALPTPGTPADQCVTGGNAASETWTLTSVPPGSNAVLSTTTGASPVFTVDAPGTYGVQLVVTDNGGFSTVFNTTVKAGACLATLTPSGSFAYTFTDPETAGGSSPAQPHPGDSVSLTPQTVTSSCSANLSYEWSLISRPSGSQAALSSTTVQSPLLGTDVAGVYQLALVIRDGVGNATTPIFYSVTADGCGTFAPTFGVNGGVTFSGSPRANADITLTSPTASDGNAACPARFHATPISYAFSVVQAPAGAGISLSQSGGSTATLQVSKGSAASGDYKVQLVATDAKGRSTTLATPAGCTAPGLNASCVPAVNNCGAYGPVTRQFVASQSVAGTGTQPSDTLPASATTGATAAGDQVSTKGFYLGIPVSIQATVADPDFDTVNACPSPFNVGGTQTTTNVWTLVSAPAGSHATIGANTGSGILFTPDVAGGPYKFALTSTDNTGNATTSTFSLSVNCGNNSPRLTGTGASLPAASQSPAYPGGFALGQAVSVTATANDDDKTAAGACTVNQSQTFTYAWSFNHVPAGSSAALLSPNTQSASFVPDVAGPYGLTLTVTDPQGHSITDTSLSVDAECGIVPPSVSLVTAGIPDFTLTQGPMTLFLSNGTTTSVTITHASKSSNNSPGNKAFYPNVPVQLQANVPTSVPQGGTCGAQTDTISYQWSIASAPVGSRATINNPTAQSPSFTPDVSGTYDFQLKVIDQNGRSSTTLLSIDDVANPNTHHPGNVGTCGINAPTVTAIATGPTPVGVRAQFDATGSTSPDDWHVSPYTTTTGCGLNLPLSYDWVLTSSPSNSAAVLSSETVINPTLTPDVAGSYTVQVTASDGRNSASQSVSVTAVSGNTSAPGTASGSVYTAVATDINSNPVVAWWDNTAHSVKASRCSANCTSASPTWISLGTIDSNLGAVSFGSEDEGRPVAIKVGSVGGVGGVGNVFVVYYTGGGSGSTAQVQPYCNAVLAQWVGGTSWNRQELNNSDTGSGCDAALSAGHSLGRYLSMDIDSTGSPVVGISDEYATSVFSSPTSTAIAQMCTSNCTTNVVGAGYVSSFIGTFAIGIGHGQFVSVRARGTTVDAVDYVSSNGSTRAIEYAECPTCTSTPSFSTTNIEASSALDIGRFSRLQVMPTSPNNTLMAVYRDATNKQARVATCVESSVGSCLGGGWTASTIADGASSNYGRGLALTLDASGLPRIGYFDDTHQRVRVRSGTVGGVFTSTEDFPGNASPMGLSLVFGGSNLFFSYSNSTGPQVFAGQ